MSESLDRGNHVPGDPMIGRVVERYRIERVLGRGAMGIVYEAMQLDVGRKVALKTISPDRLQDADARSRFVREAKALGRVHAQGLVDIYTVGEFADGAPYIVMEYLEGPTLRERQARSPQGRLSVDAALALVAQLASTLAELHAKGVVHREQRLNYKSCVSPTDKTAQRRRLTHATHKPDEGIPSDHIDSGIAER